jgi:hypothetical protein
MYIHTHTHRLRRGAHDGLVPGMCRCCRITQNTSFYLSVHPPLEPDLNFSPCFHGLFANVPFMVYLIRSTVCGLSAPHAQPHNAAEDGSRPGLLRHQVGGLIELHKMRIFRLFIPPLVPNLVISPRTYDWWGFIPKAFNSLLVYHLPSLHTILSQGYLQTLRRNARYRCAPHPYTPYPYIALYPNPYIYPMYPITLYTLP